MADEPTTNQEIAPTENESIETGNPTSSSPLPINTDSTSSPQAGSEPSNIPLEAPESPINADNPVSLNNDNPEK